MEKPSYIILASSSPRRIELLTQTGMTFTIHPSSVDERTLTYASPRELALKAAYAKATDVAQHYSHAVVIGADTVVCSGNEIFWKPRNEEEAGTILTRLRGRDHTVITGIAVKESDNTTAALDAVETRVTMRNLTDQEIDEYIATGEPMDKAGAYAIQDEYRMVEKIEGCYFNVVGLPLSRVLEMLREFIPEHTFHLPENPWT